mmetsp:Transcript_17310/g.53737  ORF Transcript_17310/g.53737 Transcript_17310/m.53737 type:complete len:307 (+) Transcript_17310:580-1500(+)
MEWPRAGRSADPDRWSSATWNEVRGAHHAPAICQCTRVRAAGAPWRRGPGGRMGTPSDRCASPHWWRAAARVEWVGTNRHASPHWRRAAARWGYLHSLRAGVHDDGCPRRARAPAGDPRRDVRHDAPRRSDCQGRALHSGRRDSRVGPRRLRRRPRQVRAARRQALRPRGRRPARRAGRARALHADRRRRDRGRHRQRYPPAPRRRGPRRRRDVRQAAPYCQPPHARAPAAPVWRRGGERRRVRRLRSDHRAAAGPTSRSEVPRAPRGEAHVQRVRRAGAAELHRGARLRARRGAFGDPAGANYPA